MAETFEFLCVAIDANPIWWGRLMEEHNDDRGLLLKKVVQSIVSYCQAFKFINSLNHLLVIAARSTDCITLYCDSINAPGTLTDSIMDGLQEFLQKSPESCQKETKLAGTLSTALCYSNRLKKDSPPNQKMLSRVLIFKISDDVCSQYMSLMNIFFTAQKQEILIDACVLCRDSAIMQQACDITGGIYIKVSNVHALLQYLLGSFLPDNLQRSKMLMPISGDVDYRPACFCHQRLISIGWVCSVCLSVYCQFSPICATCQSVFKFLPTNVPKMVKKKKK